VKQASELLADRDQLGQGKGSRGKLRRAITS
jgi:hypothetical protein